MTNEAYVHIRGDDGPILFCLHGLRGDGAEFEGLSSLTDRYRVMAWDAPGQGASPALVDAPSLDWYAEQAACAIEAHAAGPVHVLGSGWGGMIAMALAGARQDLVRSMILANAALRVDAADSARTAGSPTAGDLAAASSVPAADLGRRLRGIQLPALVIAGEDADADAIRASEDVSAAIADAVFVTMRHAGTSVHLEQPVTFATWVRSFLYIVDRVREAV